MFPLFRRILTATLALAAGSLIANSARAQTPPTPDYMWNNFVGGTPNWSTANNWLPVGPPTSSIDRVLGFTSSSLQTAQGYGVTFDQAAFDVNSLVFTSQASSATSINILLGTLANQRLQFNTSSTNVLPSIWQMGSGSVTFTNGQSMVGMTLMNATNLQILGNGIGNLNLNANIVELNGSSALTLNQTGTRAYHTGSQVRLGGGNSFSGGVTLTAGNLVLASNSGLGTGTFTVNTAPGAGSLQFDPAVTSGFAITNNIQLNQTLVITGQSTAATPTIFATFSGTIAGSGGLTFNNYSNAMNYQFNGANTFSGAVTIAPRGNTANNIFLGSDTVATGTFSGTTSITIGYNALLRLNNVAGVATRLNTTTAPSLTLHTGNFQLYGNGTANASETLGQLTVTGQGAIAAIGASNIAQTTTLNFSGLIRNSNGTLFFTATNLGSNTGAGESIIRFTTDPGGALGGGSGAGTTTRSILPYAFASFGGMTTTTLTSANNFGGFVAWDSATSRIVPLNQTSEYAPSLPVGASPTLNVRLASSAAQPNANSAAGLTAPTTVNSLLLDTNTAASNRIGVSVAGPGTLTVAGGAVGSTVSGSAGTLPGIPSLINVGELTFGSNPGYAHTFANLIVNSPISGNAGVVKAASGLLQLNGTNNFTGGLTVNAGLVQFTANENLGNPAAPVYLNGGLGGGLQLLAGNLYGPASLSTVTANRSIDIGVSGTAINIGTANTNLALTGVISGPGQLNKVGAGVLTLSGNNTFTGGLTLSAGTVRVGSDGSLGGAGGDLNLFGGTLETTGTFTIARNTLLTASPVLFNPDAGSNVTFSGNLTSQVAAGVAVLKDGPGDVTFTDVNTLLGSYQNGISSPGVRGSGLASPTNSGRTILSGPDGSFPTAASIFAIGNGEFVLDNTAAVNNNRIGTVTVSIIGGGFRVNGNASAPVSESIGAISFSNANNPYGGTVTLSTPAGSGQRTTVNALSLSANTALGTVFVRGTGLGAATGDRSALILGSQAGLLVNGLIPSLVGATSATSEPTDFLTTQTIGNAAPNANQFSLIPFTAYTPAAGALGTGAAANTYDVTAASSFGPGASAATALRMRGASLDLGGGTLTLGAAHILSSGGTPASIGNGTLAFGTLHARFTVTSGSDLTVSAGTTGSGGLIKSGLGVLTLNTPSTISLTATGYGIAQGTLRYGVNDALPTATVAFINAGATLDLNGTTSTLGSLVGYGNVALGNGTLTFGNAFQGQSTTALQYGGAFSGTGSLVKSGTANFTAAGDSSGYAGQVSILNGTLTVNSNAAIGTGPVLLGDTAGTNQALLTLGTTVTNFSNPITIQPGGSAALAHRITAPVGMVTVSGNIAINNTLASYTANGLAATGIGLDLRGPAGATGGNTNQTGVISGAGGLLVFSGNWSFFGNNTYTGNTSIDPGPTTSVGIGIDSTPASGTVTSGPFGTGHVTFSTVGTNLRALGGPRTVGNEIRLVSGAYFGVTGTNPLTLTGPMNFTAGATAPSFVISNTAVTTVSGVIQNGTQGFIKNGPGTLNLTGNNTYTGTTIVNAGVLLVNNTTGNAAQAVTINSGAVFGGAGSIGGNLTVNAGGTVGPGNSTGILTVNGNATLAAGTTYQVEINGNTVDSLYDQLNVTGTIDITGVNLAVQPLQNPASSDLYFIVRSSGVTGTFANTPGNVFTMPGFSAQISYVGNATLGTTTGGTDIVLFAPTPEPGTILTASLISLGAFGLVRRRNRSRQVV